MKINKIIIENYRSIEKIELDFNGFNVLVGQNNHGKTNFLEAVDWFFNGAGKPEDFVRKGCNINSMKVEIVFYGAQEALHFMKNQANSQSIKNKIGDSQEVKIKCSLNDKGRVERTFYNSEKEVYETTGTGANNFLNDFLPKPQFITTETYMKDVTKYGSKTEIGQMLSDVINEILISADQDYKNFLDQFEALFVGDKSRVAKELKNIGNDVENYLKKQFPDCEEVCFGVKSPKFEDLLKNFETKINDGFETDASEKGDGMQRALMLAIIQTFADYRRRKDNIKNFIFLIDEAELHLHPSAQRSLKEALLELSKSGDQVFITSHSSVLISDNSLDQNIYSVVKDNHITNIEHIKFENKFDLVFELLGGSPADLLLPRNFLLVEGKSDKIFIDKVINRFYTEKKEIQVIPVLGDIENVDKVYFYLSKIFAPLDKSLYQKTTIILLDQVSTQKQPKLLEFYKNYGTLSANRDNQVFELDCNSIERYYPIDENGIVRRFSEDEVKQMDSKRKINLAKKVSLEISQSQFETEMPIIFKALEKCWKNAY